MPVRDKNKDSYSFRSPH